VKRQKLEQLMREHGAEIKREGAKHTIWFIPATGQKLLFRGTTKSRKIRREQFANSSASIPRK
jgi:hypothetical protein